MAGVRKARQHPSTGSSLTSDDGVLFELGKRVQSGGAGSIYLLPKAPDKVAKIYHPGVELTRYEHKIRAMLQLRPDLPDVVEGNLRMPQMAWPQQILRDKQGRFRGFTMPLLHLEHTIELEYMLQERQARAAGLPVGLGARITLARNLSALIAKLHQKKHYVIDLKPVNVRFYRESLHLAMLDCDGFSIHDKEAYFPAPQYTPEYLAPEFHRQTLKRHTESAQDRFALAVIIFQLLNFGIHPFSGRPASDDVPTDVPRRIAGRYYAYGQTPHPEMHPNPASGHEQFPLDLRIMFDQAFGKNGAHRPAASKWAKVLTPYALKSSKRLVVCQANPEHQYFAGKKCAACIRAQHLSWTENRSKALRAGATKTVAYTKHPTAPPAMPHRATRAQVIPPAPPPAPSSTVNWLVVGPVVILYGLIYLPFFLLRWLFRIPMPWALPVNIVVIGCIGSLILPLLASDGSRASDRNILYPPPAHAVAFDPELPTGTQTNQAYVNTSQGYGLTSADRAQIDALLNAAQAGQSRLFRSKLLIFVKRTPPLSTNAQEKALAAIRVYRTELLAQLSHTDIEKNTTHPQMDAHQLAYIEGLDRHLEQAALTAPHDAYVLAAVGDHRLARYVGLGNNLPAMQSHRGFQATRDTYYSALSADARSPANWTALGLVCTALSDDACAVGAFAIGQYLNKAVNAGAVSPGSLDDGSIRGQRLSSLLASSPGAQALKQRSLPLIQRGTALAEAFEADRLAERPRAGRTRYGRGGDSSSAQ